MNILLLGGTGHIGSRLHQILGAEGLSVAKASRRAAGQDGSALQVDTLDVDSLARALDRIDVVVNCVAGSADAIAEGASKLAQAAGRAGCGHIVHLSTMSVYGSYQGTATETTAFDPALGWYAKAKCEAEAHMQSFARSGGRVTVMRPGCVGGPGSQLWVGRIGRWLQAHRLGDIGTAGDGWSNLVHIDDVCRAIRQAILRSGTASSLEIYNLAAPDSPRWNEYFVDLAVGVGATPVRRIAGGTVARDAKLFGPPLKIYEKLAARVGLPAGLLPEAIPPALVRFWGQHILLDASAASRALGLQWTPYRQTLKDSVDWFRKSGVSR